jgi:hypothetical protein
MPTRDQAHLAAFGSIAAIDDLVGVVDLELGVGGRDPEKRFLDDVRRIVDQLLHGRSRSIMVAVRGYRLLRVSVD